MITPARCPKKLIQQHLIPMGAPDRLDGNSRVRSYALTHLYGQDSTAIIIWAAEETLQLPLLYLLLELLQELHAF